MYGGEQSGWQDRGFDLMSVCNPPQALIPEFPNLTAVQQSFGNGELQTTRARKRGFRLSESGSRLGCDDRTLPFHWAQFGGLRCLPGTCMTSPGSVGFLTDFLRLATSIRNAGHQLPAGTPRQIWLVSSCSANGMAFARGVPPLIETDCSTSCRPARTLISVPS